MGRYDFGKPVKAIEDLNKTIEENNVKTQKYTRCLIWLTAIIAILTLVLVFDVFFRIVESGL